MPNEEKRDGNNASNSDYPVVSTAIHDPARVADILEIMQVLDKAAQQMSTRPTEQWAGWVSYLLEALDDKADADIFTGVLRGVEADITTRLEEGRW